MQLCGRTCATVRAGRTTTAATTPLKALILPLPLVIASRNSSEVWSQSAGGSRNALPTSRFTAASLSPPSSRIESPRRCGGRTAAFVGGSAGGGGSGVQRSASGDPVIQRAVEATQVQEGGSLPDSEMGIVFQPMGEAAPLVADLDRQLLDPGSQPGWAATHSLARSGFAGELEAGINEQINIELTMHYVYTAMYAYFARDEVGLPGFAAHFRHNSSEERGHADLLIGYQAQRGGRVKLRTIAAPQTEYWHPEKGDALYATELALSLEKLNFTKLRELHDLAARSGDADTTHFIEDNLLHEQSKDVKEAAVLVSQVRRAGRGHGVFHVDTLLAGRYGAGDGAGPLAG